MEPGISPGQPPPFHQLNGYNFERLCRDLLDAEPSVATCEVYGVRGQTQYGIDLLAHWADGDSVEVGQCKCYERFPPAKIEEVRKEFFKHYCAQWKAKKVKKFILFVACDLFSTQHQEKIIEEKQLFSRFGIAYEVWGAAEIRNKLRLHQGIVSTYLTPPEHWVRVIRGESEIETTKEHQLSEIERSLEDLHSRFGAKKCPYVAFAAAPTRRHELGFNFRDRDVLHTLERFGFDSVAGRYSGPLGPDEPFKHKEWGARALPRLHRQAAEPDREVRIYSEGAILSHANSAISNDNVLDTKSFKVGPHPNCIDSWERLDDSEKSPYPLQRLAVMLYPRDYEQKIEGFVRFASAVYKLDGYHGPVIFKAVIDAGEAYPAVAKGTRRNKEDWIQVAEEKVICVTEQADDGELRDQTSNVAARLTQRAAEGFGLTGAFPNPAPPRYESFLR